VKISLSRKEAEWIISQELCPDSLKAKLVLVEKPPGVNAGMLEKAMEQSAKGKVVRLVTGAGYATASRMATKLAATVEDAALLGTWLSMQGWLGPQTLVDVLRKWDTWLPKARALNGPHTGQGATGKRVPSL